MQRKLSLESNLVFADEGAPELPGGFEAIGGDPRKLDLGTLVEDELLLGLPLIPHHEADEACGMATAPAGVADESMDEAAEMRRPFAGLKDLLKH